MYKINPTNNLVLKYIPIKTGIVLIDEFILSNQIDHLLKE